MATHARLAPRPGTAARARTWWGKAWVRAVEESAYGEGELRRGRTLARGGRVGAITVEPGGFLAAVEEGDDVLTVTGSVPVLDASGLATFTETVAAEAGRVAALLAGDLPHGLVEHAEEAGVELLPFGGELATRCSCEPWTDPCHHALAVLQQLTWLLEADPFVLLALRGIERDELLARLHAAAPAGPEETDPDLDLAVDAAQRAARVLELLADPDAPVDHLL
ncbi:hypothetical protein [Nocardioides euryhalodurans]|uniref:SWIM-type domain-containing protein n=1 Tax=Nocardioides euryhalodurans TaxID=2518370 RepID=A0A4P7GM31_9ACTN|nr:hypothetical protein [Nocardioides euryhalodurans]QBR92801.1 hypothetical protein EXE57_11340 [Nocardioides euryhalodurans]